MKTRSLKRNAIFNTIRSLLSFLFPVLSYSYAARVIGVDNMGSVNYTLSIVSYFGLIAVFGMSTYGVRECTAIRDDEQAVSRRVSELLSFNVFSMIISLILLGLCVLVIVPLHSYAWLFVIQSLSIVFTVVGMDWVNVVFEDYGYITLRGLAISTLNLLILLAFVKSEEDYYIYAFLTVLTPVVVGLTNFFYIRKYVSVGLCKPVNIVKQMRILWPFFINDMSVAVYVGADMIILGALKGDYYVGLYNAAVKIYTIVKSVFIAIFSVTILRLSYHRAHGDDTGYEQILSNVISVFILLGFPGMVGLILYAPEIILIISGADYAPAMFTLRLLAVALIFAIFGGIATSCINVPCGHERVNSRATVIAAIENTVLNIPAIYLWGINGAAATTILAEATVLGICLIFYRRRGLMKAGIIVWRDIRDTIVGVVAIVGVYAAVSYLIPGYILRAIAGIGGSVLLYGGVMIVLKNHIVYDILKGRNKGNA